MLENVIPRVLGWVPVSLRRAVISRPDKPTGISTVIHNLLNRIPQPTDAIACRGVLEGYRMLVDWTRFRSFVYGTWEPEVTGVITSILHPGMTVIDIGAHIGYYSLLFAKCVGPAGRVFSFEPLPENFALLQRNIRINDLGNVQSYCAAVFSSAGEISLSVPDSPNSGDGSVMHDWGSKRVLAQAITLDSFCRGENIRPDLIKLDVEGAEYEALKGATETIKNHGPKLLIELHHFDGNPARNPVPSLLTDWGYHLHWIERWQLTSYVLALPRSVSHSEALPAKPR